MEIEYKKKHFVELGNLITGLIEFMKRKSIVHHSTKEQARAVKAMYNKAKDDVLQWNTTSSWYEGSVNSDNSEVFATWKGIQTSKRSGRGITQIQSSEEKQKIIKAKDIQIVKELSQSKLEAVKQLTDGRLWNRKGNPEKGEKKRM